MTDEPKMQPLEATPKPVDHRPHPVDHSGDPIDGHETAFDARKIKRLKAITLVLLLGGTAIMVPWEYTLTLLTGCVMLLTGIGFGLYAVAEPGFLTGDAEHPPKAKKHRKGAPPVPAVEPPVEPAEPGS